MIIGTILALRFPLRHSRQYTLQLSPHQQVQAIHRGQFGIQLVLFRLEAFDDHCLCFVPALCFFELSTERCKLVHLPWLLPSARGPSQCIVFLFQSVHCLCEFLLPRPTLVQLVTQLLFFCAQSLDLLQLLSYHFSLLVHQHMHVGIDPVSG